MRHVTSTKRTLRKHGTERYYGKKSFLNRVAMEMHNLKINIQKLEGKIAVFLYASLIRRIYG